MVKNSKKHKDEPFFKMIHSHRKAINYIFLGVGLMLFAINMTTFMAFVDTLSYDKVFFNLSLFSSMIIVLVAVYHIYEGNKDF